MKTNEKWLGALDGCIYIDRSISLGSLAFPPLSITSLNNFIGWTLKVSCTSLASSSITPKSWDICWDSDISTTYGHRLKRIGHPVRSAIRKLHFTRQTLLLSPLRNPTIAAQIWGLQKSVGWQAGIGEGDWVNWTWTRVYVPVRLETNSARGLSALTSSSFTHPSAAAWLSNRTPFATRVGPMYSTSMSTDHQY